MRIFTLPTLLQFLLWCFSIQKSMQAAMPPSSISDTEYSGTNRIRLLFSRNSGSYVRIPGRNIEAKAGPEDPYALIRFKTIDFNETLIQGVKSKYYLCINSRGDLVGKRKPRSNEGVSCVFHETYSESYYVLIAAARRKDWLVGFNRHGEPRRATRNRPSSRASHFMVIPLSNPEEDNNMKYFSDEIQQTLWQVGRESGESISRTQSGDSNR
ncbi:fibroblast growth factor 8b-like isoform X2 [Diadema antillarum]|uniref:fibroblast growth factor 8b-like isoform X1 n=1 Tax=Diadema antillarum TaxID=105358 RepID=UPI003A88638C